MNATLNTHGHLIDLSEPKVMGILNVTPDSFYAASRQQTEEAVVGRARQILAEGGDIIDVGACSTRPGSEPVSEAEERERLGWALALVTRELPEAVVSVDTFRPDVARMAVEEYGACIINDVSGGEVGRMAARLRTPYIYMSNKGVLRDVLLDCAARLQQLHDLGLSDIIIDPGFGFGKTVEQDHRLLHELEKLQVLEKPLLVGISRKSMVYRPLGTTPDDALTGTTALHAIALQKGASLLRVHDVKDAVACVKISKTTRPQKA